jgi:hypothetical protein
MAEKKVLIGVIETNDYSVTDCIPQKNTYDDLYDYLLDFIEFKSVPESQVMNEVSAQIGMDKHKIITGDTTKIYENNKIIIDMCYGYDNPEDDVNHVAQFAKDGICGLINVNDAIKGNVVCIKSTVNEHGKCHLENISLSDIVNAVHRKIVKRAVMINPPNEIVHYDYVIDPVEMLIDKEKENYKFFNFPFIGNDVKIFVEIEPSCDKTNDICSAIFNKNYVIGRCILTMTNDKGIFIDIDKEYDMVTKILRVLCDKSQVRSLNEKNNEDVESHIVNDEKIINNFGRLLTNRANNSKINHKLNNILCLMAENAHDEPTINELVKKQIATNELVGPKTEITEDDINNKINELSS